MMFPFLFLKKTDLLCSEAAMLRDLTDVIKAQLALQDRRKCVKEKICGFVFSNWQILKNTDFFTQKLRDCQLSPGA